MSNLVNFDAGCEVIISANRITAMIECYCLGAGTTIKDFALQNPIAINGYNGTISFQGLNWSWWRKWWKPNTAICGTVGSTMEPFLDFDIQGNGAPQLLAVEDSFPAMPLDKLRFNLYPDLTLPTDFRVALVLYRCG